VREKKQFAEAELVEVKESSSHRVIPECSYFGRLRRIAYQYIGYEHQRRLMASGAQRFHAHRQAQRYSSATDHPVAETVGYRNRITVHAQDGVIGFFRRDSHHLIDVERCPISCEEVNRELMDLRDEVRAMDIIPYARPRAGASSLKPMMRLRMHCANLIVILFPPNQDLLIDAYCGAGFFG